MEVKSLNPIKLLQMIFDELHLLRLAYEKVHQSQMEYAKQRATYEKHPIAKKRLMEYATQDNLVVDPDWDLESEGLLEDEQKETYDSVLGKEV